MQFYKHNDNDVHLLCKEGLHSLSQGLKILNFMGLDYKTVNKQPNKHINKHINKTQMLSIYVIMMYIIIIIYNHDIIIKFS